MCKISVARARKTIQDAFSGDPDFRDVYRDRISCSLLDTKLEEYQDKDYRDSVADSILSDLLG